MSRRHLNQTFYEAFYPDDLEVTDDEKTPIFGEIHQAATEYGEIARLQHQESLRNAEASSGTSTLTDLLNLAEFLPVKRSHKTVMVELRGFEPLNDLRF